MSERNTPEVNAGSMADIAFLLLIFFLVTTTMDTEIGIYKRLPEKQDQPTDILVKENRLIAQGSVRGLQNDIAKIDDLNQTLAGVYVGGSCGNGDDGDYYYHRYKKIVNGEKKYLSKLILSASIF